MSTWKIHVNYRGEVVRWEEYYGRAVQLDCEGGPLSQISVLVMDEFSWDGDDREERRRLQMKLAEDLQKFLNGWRPT